MSTKPPIAARIPSASPKTLLTGTSRSHATAARSDRRRSGPMGCARPDRATRPRWRRASTGPEPVPRDLPRCRVTQAHRRDATPPSPTRPREPSQTPTAFGHDAHRQRQRHPHMRSNPASADHASTRAHQPCPRYSHSRPPRRKRPKPPRPSGRSATDARCPCTPPKRPAACQPGIPARPRDDSWLPSRTTSPTRRTPSTPKDRANQQRKHGNLSKMPSVRWQPCDKRAGRLSTALRSTSLRGHACGFLHQHVVELGERLGTAGEGREYPFSVVEQSAISSVNRSWAT